MRASIMIRAARPPTTPPAIAALFDFSLSSEGVSLEEGPLLAAGMARVAVRALKEARRVRRMLRSLLSQVDGPVRVAPPVGL